MRILITLDNYPNEYGGIQQYIKGLGMALKKKRHNVTILSWGPKDKLNEKLPEGEYCPTGLLKNSLSRPFEALKRFKEIAVLIKKINPDIIYTNNHCSLAIIKAAHMLNLPVVYGCHGVGLLCPLKIRFLKPNDDLCYNERNYVNCLNCLLMLKGYGNKNILKRATYLILNPVEMLQFLFQIKRYHRANKILESTDMIVGNSHLTASLFRGSTVGIHLAIDCETYKPVDATHFKEKHKLDEYIICTSRIHNTKGQEYLIQALPYLDKNIKLVLAGDNIRRSYPYHEKILTLVKKLKLEDRVIFAGLLKKEELIQAYSGARVSVMPSVWIETYGYVVPESLACGTPVVLTENSGSVEIVDETCARIVPRKNPQAIADAVIEIWDNAEEMGQAGRKKMIEELNWDVTTNKLLDIFYNVLNSNKNTTS
jgi:glycosyltransferase involved in cell wall biosynthesis